MTLSYLSSMVLARRTHDKTQEQQVRELHNVCGSLQLGVMDTGAALANKDKETRKQQLLRASRKIDLSINQLQAIRQSSFTSTCDKLLSIAEKFKHRVEAPEETLDAGMAKELETTYKALDSESRHLAGIPSAPATDLTTVAKISDFVTVAAFVAAAAAAFYILSKVATSLNQIKDNCARFRSNLPLLPVEHSTDELRKLDENFQLLFDTVSKLVRAEKALLENSKDCIFSLDRNGFLQTSNPATRELLGEVIGRDLKTLTATIEVQRLHELLELSANSNEPQRAVLYLSNIQSGLQHPVEAIIRWSEPDAAYFVIGRDITKEQEIEKLKSEFFTRMNSQLSEPLQSLEDTVTQLMQGQHGELNSKGQATLLTAQSSLVRLIQLLKDLQCLSQMERCELTVTPKRVDIADVLCKAVAEMTPFGAAKGIDISVLSEHDLVSIDPDRIIQVLINLLSNAIKFSARDTSVTVSSKLTKGDVQILVEDQGRGIASEDLPGLFDRFRQTRISDSLELGGSGLGLYVCKGIVEQHGGTIEVFSQPAQGTKFLIAIPQADS